LEDKDGGKGKNMVVRGRVWRQDEEFEQKKEFGAKGNI
jgi:hypothetical protein